MTHLSTAIGIDLGTTNSAAAVLEEGVVRVLPNRLGELLTPSVVALDRGSDALLVGRPARELSALAPERAVATFKRGMGEEGTWSVGGRELGAVELSACVLRQLREDAAVALGRAVQSCVITVPAYFSEEQRFATIKAGELAGLEVLRILNEPTAAAMAHGLHRRDEDCNFLVFDLGGGTFDVCVMERFAGVLQVRSTAGESRLGGEDFTRGLASFVLAEIGLGFEQVEVSDPAAMGLLLKRCELAKRRLSEAASTAVAIPPIRGVLAKDAPVEVSRSDAEKAWEPLLDRLIAPCRAALRGGRLGPADLDELILVGGATRMLAVRELARQLFGREPTTEVDPDLAVVHGAAIQAALCLRDAAVEDVVVTDVLSHSLGVDVAKTLGGRHVEGYFSPIIHRNTVIPTSRVESYQTVLPNQTQIEFRIFEGESRRVEDNRLIGNMVVSGIPKGPAGQVVEIRLTYDLNGVLEAEARVLATDKAVAKIFNRSSQSLSEAELARAAARIAKLKEDPRQDAELRDLMLRAELLWQELPPERRWSVDRAMDALEAAIETRNQKEISFARDILRDICNEIDGGERW